MFKAHMISLSGDLVYKNVQILMPDDIVRMGIELYFEKYTCVFFVENKCIHVNHSNINLIQLDRRQRTTPYTVDEIIVCDEMRYMNSCIIKKDEWESRGIPTYFNGHEGLSGQFAWSNNEGTFITLDSNIISIINSDPRRTGATPQTIPDRSKITSIPTAQINHRNKSAV